jgi:hypothetical protein
MRSELDARSAWLLAAAGLEPGLRVGVLARTTVRSSTRDGCEERTQKCRRQDREDRLPRPAHRFTPLGETPQYEWTSNTLLLLVQDRTNPLYRSAVALRRKQRCAWQTPISSSRRTRPRSRTASPEPVRSRPREAPPPLGASGAAVLACRPHGASRSDTRAPADGDGAGRGDVDSAHRRRT